MCTLNTNVILRTLPRNLYIQRPHVKQDEVFCSLSGERIYLPSSVFSNQLNFHLPSTFTIFQANVQHAHEILIFI